ncbi:NAD(P)-binding protein [Cylindrospermum sp. FACHB-282]|uniref:NAD(P)-binding protein n=1 Tax=Cylindrospermum sp. FACHB-282 TaxID=2692794 RepID=UPI001688CD61|nr:NAD(P)-binding protein [Cylindrospermum sp. FACHB-282]MBD2385101.1 NAD(P)-binding protein [Cylindrospermum sp. FACHB-282]
MTKKIAILGGGMAGLALAYELTSIPGWEKKYSIEIYQQGWRLGGKCATGRNIVSYGSNPADYRVEEHGLHIFFGFYVNTFRLLNQCYKEIGGAGPFKSLEDAFKPHSDIFLTEYFQGKWKTLEFNLSQNKLVPWDESSKGTLWDHVLTTIKFVLQTYGELKQPSDKASDKGSILNFLESGKDLVQLLLLSGFIEITEEILLILGGQKEFGNLDPENLSIQILDKASNINSKKPSHQKLVLHLLEQFREKVLRIVSRDFDTSWRLALLDLALANIRGLIVDGIIYGKNLDSLDNQDYRDWLKKHGARKESTESCFIRVLYDLVYAFPKGDTSKPSLAAGVAIRVFITVLFKYNGAIMWKPQAGFADVVVSPIYKLLKQRGVKFKFFHTVKQLHIDGNTIAGITVEKQVDLKQAEYEPLIEFKSLDCWPNKPLYDQIVYEQAEQLQQDGIDLESFWTNWKGETKKLQKGEDFDIAVLATSLAPLSFICKEIVDRSDEWRDMLCMVKTVPTQGGQLWLKSTLNGLGWKKSSPVLGAYVEPISVYADMTDLIKIEYWSEKNYPYSLAYFTGVIKDPGIPLTFPQKDIDELNLSAINFLENHIGYLWNESRTGACPPGFNWDLLVDPLNRTGRDRFYSQYWRFNLNPSERYVMSVPGSTRYRLKVDESGFDNLYMAGDWVNNGYNSGCVEATVISAMQCAKAILTQQNFGTKQNEPIVGENDEWFF